MIGDGQAKSKGGTLATLHWRAERRHAPLLPHLREPSSAGQRPGLSSLTGNEAYKLFSVLKSTTFLLLISLSLGRAGLYPVLVTASWAIACARFFFCSCPLSREDQRPGHERAVLLHTALSILPPLMSWTLITEWILPCTVVGPT